MAEEIREKIRLEDGRHAERIIRSVNDDCKCESTEVVETWVEPKPKLRLAQRQKVRRRPFVYERETEVVNEETGEVISREVEDLGEPRLQVHESIISQASLPEERDSGYVTRNELREDIVQAMQVIIDREEPVVPVRSIVEKKIEEKQETSSLSGALLLVLAAEVAGLAYILFIM